MADDLVAVAGLEGPAWTSNTQGSLAATLRAATAAISSTQVRRMASTYLRAANSAPPDLNLLNAIFV
jgi:hypothetical protein